MSGEGDFFEREEEVPERGDSRGESEQGDEGSPFHGLSVEFGIAGHERADDQKNTEEAGEQECRRVHALVEEVDEADQSEKRSKDKGDGGHA